MARAFGVRKSDFLHANTFESEPILGALFAFLLTNIVVMLFACYRDIKISLFLNLGNIVGN